MNRNVSLPSIENSVHGRADFIINKNLAVITESRDEVVRSADLRRTHSNEVAAAELRVKNELKGYPAANRNHQIMKSVNYDKENNYNILPPQQQRIISGGRRSRDEAAP